MDNDKSLNKNSTSDRPKSILITSVLIVLAMSSYVIATVAAQMFAGKITIFALNVYRFSIHSIIAMVWVVTRKDSIKVAKKDIFKLVISSGFQFIKSTLYYTAAAYLPVGNLDGFYAGFMLIFATTVDFVCQKISKQSIFVSFLALTGVTLLSQPWQIEGTSNLNLTQALCDYMGTLNLSTFANVSDFNTTSPGDMISKQLQINPVLLSYILLVIASVCSITAGNLCKSLLQSYSVSCIFFWAGISNIIYSLVIVVVLKFTSDITLMLPTGYSCLGYSILFLISVTITSVSVYCLYSFITLSKLAVTKAFGLIALYVLQRTLLKAFNPGHGNFLEILGVIFTLIASVLCPLVSIFYEKQAE